MLALTDLLLFALHASYKAAERIQETSQTSTNISWGLSMPPGHAAAAAKPLQLCGHETYSILLISSVAQGSRPEKGSVLGLELCCLSVGTNYM